MNGKIVHKKRITDSGELIDVPEYYLDNVEVDRAAFYAAFPDKDGIPGGQSSAVWPMLSDSLAVHPSQVKAAEVRAMAHGVPTTYNADGRPVVTSGLHQKKLAKLDGMRNKRGY